MTDATGTDLQPEGTILLKLPPPKEQLSVLLSAFMESLDGRKLRLAEKSDHGHFLTSYVILHRRLARALKVALDAAETEENRRRQEGVSNGTGGNPLFALDALLDAIYRAAELFEFYADDVPSYISSFRTLGYQAARDRYLGAVKNLKREWATICNRTKHNHAFLVPVEGVYEDGGWVNGFSLYSREGNALRPDSSLHSKIGAFSYNRVFRSLVADILAADAAAATAVGGLPDDELAPSIVSMQIPAPYARELLRILSRPNLSMPREPTLETRGLVLAEDNTEVASAAPIVVGTGKFRMRVLFDMLETNMELYAPYIAGQLTVNFPSQANGDRRPIGVFLRLDAHDLMVDP